MDDAFTHDRYYMSARTIAIRGPGGGKERHRFIRDATAWYRPGPTHADTIERYPRGRDQHVPVSLQPALWIDTAAAQIVAPTPSPVSSTSRSCHDTLRPTTTATVPWSRDDDLGICRTPLADRILDAT